MWTYILYTQTFKEIREGENLEQIGEAQKEMRQCRIRSRVMILSYLKNVSG